MTVRSLWAALVGLCCLTGLFAAGGREPTALKPAVRPELKITMVRAINKNRWPKDFVHMDRILKEKFNIVFERELIDGAQATQKLNLMFAAGQQPDFIENATEGQVKAWATDGQIIGLKKYIEDGKLPNYMKRFARSAEEWRLVYDFASNADNELYYLPSQRAQIEWQGWIYRKSAFDKMGLAFPRNMQEMYAVLKTIKQRHPDSVPIPNRGGLWSYSGRGFLVAHRVQNGIFVDPDTKALTYGPVTEKYRDMLKTMNVFYREKMLTPEWATATVEQNNQLYARGLAYMAFETAWGANTTYTVLAKTNEPEAAWMWSDQVDIPAYPQKGRLVSSEIPYNGTGPCMTAKASQEKVSRLLEYLDWQCSDEGILATNFGAEGFTYEIKNGKPAFTNIVYSSDNTKADHMAVHGFIEIPLVMDDGYKLAYYGQQAYDFVNHVSALLKKGEIISMSPTVWRFSVEEQKEITGLTTALNTMRDEYAVQFIMGNKDPAKDAAWKAYLDDLKRLQIERYTVLYDTNFRRMAK